MTRSPHVRSRWHARGPPRSMARLTTIYERFPDPQICRSQPMSAGNRLAAAHTPLESSLLHIKNVELQLETLLRRSPYAAGSLSFRQVPQWQRRYSTLPFILVAARLAQGATHRPPAAPVRRGIQGQHCPELAHVGPKSLAFILRTAFHLRISSGPATMKPKTGSPRAHSRGAGELQDRTRAVTTWVARWLSLTPLVISREDGQAQALDCARRTLVPRLFAPMTPVLQTRP
ncbi:hypothetical protein C8Q77DRAFT_925083 [Trametes polyzona]|nr:hypothetical protein C8Q77DRAFT_925083 [Trametes polyzona]